MKSLQSLLWALLLCISSAVSAEPTCPEYLNTELRRLHSQEKVTLCSYYQAGKPLLIVNTASHCGFTEQFGGLEALYKKYHEQGLVVLGFPSNSFNQEESSEEGTARVCFKNFGVTFPMFEHLEVKGKSAHPLFQHLAKMSKAPSWNFNKYLVVGNKVTHFGSGVAPENSKLEKAIKQAL
jgi:glutathione peroxidase